MKEISYVRFSEAISRASIKIVELSLADTEKFLLEKEEIILSEIQGLGIRKGEPLFDLIRSEFYRILKFCPND